MAKQASVIGWMPRFVGCEWMQEGTLLLIQMAKMAAGLARLRDARIPYISVLCDPTTGVVAASFASLGDIVT